MFPDGLVLAALFGAAGQLAAVSLPADEQLEE